MGDDVEIWGIWKGKIRDIIGDVENFGQISKSQIGFFLFFFVIFVEFKYEVRMLE